MSRILDTIGALEHATEHKEYDRAIHMAVWDIYYLQRMLAELCGNLKDYDANMTISSDAMHGLFMLTEHCANLAVDVIGILPPLEAKAKPEGL